MIQFYLSKSPTPKILLPHIRGDFTNNEKCVECKDEENECGVVKLDPGYTW